MKRRRTRPPKPYKSWLEYDLQSALGDDFKYEAESLDYTITSLYTPDFVYGNVWVEVKGFFRSGDQRKYLAIAEELQDHGKELVFIFSNPHKAVRKGAKLTMAGWAEKHGLQWFNQSDTGELRAYVGLGKRIKQRRKRGDK